MSQNYTPTEWVDNRTVGTASVMNNMEKGIEDAHDRIDGVDSQIKDIENNNNYISVKNFGAKGDGVTDDTKAIQDTINFANENKLKVLIDEGIYKISKLNVYNATVIEGANRNKTILKIKENSNENFISINGTSIRYVTLRNFTIDGNKNNVSTEITAIYTDQETDTHHLFENLTIKNMSGSGIRLSRGENRLNNLYIHHCNRWGIGHVGSDNVFTNISCAWNYLGGVYEGGASSRWINCKCFVNGESDNIGNKPHKESNGFKICDSRGVIMTNCEAQENYGHGFDISNYSNAIINGCRADCNGMINKDVTSLNNLKKLCGISLSGVNDSIIDITCDDFRIAYGFTDLNWQYAGIVFADNNSKNNYINAKIVNNVETLLYTNWDNYVSTLKSDYKNTIIINGVEVSDKVINSKLALIEDRFDTARLDVGDVHKENNNCWRIMKETDGSLRVRLIVNKKQVNDQLQFNKNGLIVGANNTMLGFYGKVPVIQETIVNDATDLSSVITLANNIRYILKNIGLCK